MKELEKIMSLFTRIVLAVVILLYMMDYIGIEPVIAWTGLTVIYNGAKQQ